MQTARIAAFPLLVIVSTTNVLTQADAPAGPTFEVVSIKRNLSHEVGSRWVDRPDRGFTATNISVSVLIARAYPATELIGLPTWVRSERYDVVATPSFSGATLADRNAMLRAMLADRFALVVHIEKRDRDVYDLILARSDGQLGGGIAPTSTDCGPTGAAEGGGDRGVVDPGLLNGQGPRLENPPPPCTHRVIAARLRRDSDVLLGDLLEGDAPLDTLAMTLRMYARRPVVNKTNLSGSYRVRMNFDMTAAVGGPDLNPSKPNTAPSVFTAVQEQLGMKLQSSQAALDTLVIDRLERPTDN